MLVQRHSLRHCLAMACTTNDASWPDLFRPSTSFFLEMSEVVDARNKCGHDDWCPWKRIAPCLKFKPNSSATSTSMTAVDVETHVLIKKNRSAEIIRAALQF